MSLATVTFGNARNERLVEARLKAFLLALGRLALAARMECARVEIEHGQERLWLQPEPPLSQKQG